jgi:hypothetical protein
MLDQQSLSISIIVIIAIIFSIPNPISFRFNKLRFVRHSPDPFQFNSLTFGADFHFSLWNKHL